MCGIALSINNGLFSEVEDMGHAIKHRGIKHEITQIDDIKAWFSWLPIVNQKAPMQPFTVGKWTVWMNGFISNYKELAEKYGIKLWTDCDTLLLAEFLNKFDLARLNELNGFFAIVAYDNDQVHAFTDRYGVKQLYKYTNGRTTYIASEVKALLKIMPTIKLNRLAVEDWEYSLGVMTDNTIYEGITRVECLPFIHHPTIINIPYEDAKTELIRLLKQSFVRNKATISDGVFLSGGIDSGIIAKWMQPDYSFSMDYLTDLSELNNIKLNSTGIHHTMICNDKLKEQFVQKTIQAIDDLKVGSCYTNFALTELASKFCTVIYSGAGGDELFYGYTHRYNKPINDVINRTGLLVEKYFISHEEYDWRFLKGILVVEDRIGGWHTMETRYPFLDNDLVDFVLSLPKEYRYNKKILREVSGLHEEVVNGRKRGFSNPHFTNKEWTDFALNESCRLYHPI